MKVAVRMGLDIVIEGLAATQTKLCLANFFQTLTRLAYSMLIDYTKAMRHYESM